AIFRPDECDTRLHRNGQAVRHRRVGGARQRSRLPAGGDPQPGVPSAAERSEALRARTGGRSPLSTMKRLALSLVLRSTAVVALSLHFAACGSDDKRPIGSLDQRLSGIWGGYFPGSSLQHPENGIEIHFDRRNADGTFPRAAFVH